MTPAGSIPARLRASAWGVAAGVAILILIAFVFRGYLDIPLRLYDHQLLILLAEKPELAGDGLIWRLVHCHLGSETDLHFRYLAYPAVWLPTESFKNASLGHYLVHFSAHGAAAFSLYRTALAFTGLGWLSLAASCLFTVFSAASDMVGIPYYFHLCLATAFAGPALVGMKRHLETGRTSDLVLSTLLSLLASLFYDTFFLMTLVMPFVASGLASGSWRGCFTRKAPWILCGAVIGLFLAGSTAYSLVPPHLRSTGPLTSLWDTLSIILLRTPISAVTSLLRFLVDATGFLAGCLPELSHPGNIPYWDIGSLCRTAGAIAAAAGLMAFGAHEAQASSGFRKYRGAALCGIGLILDWRAAPLAFLLVFVRGNVSGILRDPAFLLIAAAGYLCAFNTSVGRSRLYSLAAIRHHYVTSFFLILGLSRLLAHALRRDPAPFLKKGVALVLASLIVLNARASLRFLDLYREVNTVPLGFHRRLGQLAAQEGPGVLFVPHSTARIASPDWRGHVVHDWVFDILLFGNNPLTRHTGRARWLWENGSLRPNPLFAGAPSPDFLIRFRLDTEKFPLRFDVKPRYACFGRNAGEPRLLLEREGLVLAVTRHNDGQPGEYRFPIPLGTNRFFYETKSISLSREGNVLVLASGERPLASHAIAPGDEYRPWTSDNMDLMGDDLESLLAKHNLFESYIRIGPSIPGRVP